MSRRPRDFTHINSNCQIGCFLYTLYNILWSVFVCTTKSNTRQGTRLKYASYFCGRSETEIHLHNNMQITRVCIFVKLFYTMHDIFLAKQYRDGVTGHKSQAYAHARTQNFTIYKFRTFYRTKS